MEYIIWGIPPNKTEEDLLYTEATSQEDADRVIAILEKEHGCTKCHVQILDLSQPFDFVKAAGLKG